MAASPEHTALMARGLLRSWTGAFLTVGLLIAAPAQAHNKPTIAESLSAMQARDQRLLDIGWKLVTGNAPFCENVRPDIGLLLLNTGSFTNPAEIAAALNTRGPMVVQAVAANSPAARAGLAPPMTVTAIGGEAAAARPVMDAPSWQELARANRRIATALVDTGSVRLQWQSEHGPVADARLAGVPACDAVMEPRDNEDSARADGNRILIGSNFPGFAHPEDEFAAAIAHELAHIVLSHSAWLDDAGRSRRKIRMTEREADRLAPWLLANAGYDPLAAERFMRRWGPDHGGGLFRKRTHDGWDQRAEAMAAEAALVTAAMQRSGNGTADWQRHFVRGITP